MEQATQTFNRILLLIPLLLSLIPVLLFYAGYRASRTESCTFAGKSLYWLGGHGVTIVLVALLTVLRGAGLPGTMIIQLPFIITALYLCFGLALNRPFLFSLGLATPP
ncbi:MAG: hypothetical protein LBN33_02775, partial [Desulfovibrio sp.]|nr:hypothetical protein [Desulfovibrio sp.]